jgi:sensor histidine kinase YesM
MAWVEDNRRKVDQLSGGRLGYVHLRNVRDKVPHYKETFIDDGEVVEPDHVGGNGIGLANVRDRLEARYKSAARLDTQAIAGGGFVANLSLPLNPRIHR